MPQLHCYVSDDLATRLQDRASQVQLPVSKYLALLIKQDVKQQWPANYFDLYGSWEGEPLMRDQPKIEKREKL
jgi:predicted LPLAT superfamily acyltransferase